MLPEIIFRNQAISAATRSHEWPKALSILLKARSESLRPTLVTYNSALKAYRSSWRRALHMLNGMRSSDVQADVISYNTTMDSLQSSSSWELVLLLLLQTPEANEISQNSALSVLEKSARWREAGCLLCKDSFASVIGFNAAISCCEKAALWPLALESMHAMEMCGVQRDQISFTSAMTAASSTWTKVCWILEELHEKLIKADVVLYNAAISAAEKMSNWQVALALLQHMDDVSLQIDTISLNAAISTCAKSAEWQWALQLLEMFYQNSVPLSVVTSAAVISALDQSGTWRLALQHSCGNPTIASIVGSSAAISACGKGHRWQQAMWVLTSAVKEQQLRANLVSFNSTLTACELATHWRWSALVLQELQLQHLESQVLSLNGLLKALSHERRAPGVWRLAAELLQRALGDEMPMDVLSYSEVIEVVGESPDGPVTMMCHLLDALNSQTIIETRGRGLF